MTAAQLTLPDFNQAPASSLKAHVEGALQHASLVQNDAAQVPHGQELAYIERLEQAENQLQQQFAVLSHLNAVRNSAEMRDIYNAVLPQISAFYTAQGQNQALYQVYLNLHAQAEFATLTPARQQAVQLALRDFRLSGVALVGEAKARYAAISARLSELSSTFSDHLLDATQAYCRPLTDAECAGLPDSSVAMLKQFGAQRDLNQPVATLDAPAYLAIMTYADDRALREELYRAYGSRASDLGAAEYDNSPIMVEILALRSEMAQLLGFANYAELSLASKMAPSVDFVREFLVDLAEKARQPALADLAQIQAEAAQVGISSLQPWDSAYFAEKIKQRRYQLSQETLKPYFPAPVVINGLFAIAQRLYGIHIVARDTSVWHDSVRYYEIIEHDQVIGGFYFDLYARTDKRGGAWMSGYRSRMQTAAGTQMPVAFMVGNFAPPVGDQPAQLSHDELVTLFHEFGHGLHHLLTDVNVLSVAGIHGVAWDAVELPSQLMEFWTWQPEALSLISQHHQTGAALPEQLLQALLAARHFQSGMLALRQLEFALFDLDLHRQNPPPDLAQIQHTLTALRQQFAVILPPPENRFAHSFSHIFAGGYAAGYYSYKWAEVLASDAFDRFEQDGIFNPDTGAAFRQAVLAVGGSRPAQDSFAAFRGREPQIDALLRHSGWTAASTNGHTTAHTGTSA